MIRSARYLAVRQVAGIGLRLAGAFAVARLIGPGEYGRYAVAASVVGLLVVVAGAGLSLTLLRRVVAPTLADEQQASSLLVATSAGSMMFGLLIVVPLLHWFLPAGYLGVYIALLISIPLNVAWLPAVARLERSFRHRELASVVIGSELAGYCVAIALAAADAGVWAPVAGAYVVQAWQLIASCRYSQYVPAWRWSSTEAVNMVRSGSAESTSGWILQAGELVSPLIAARYLGAGAAGQLAVARRLVDALAVVKRVSARLAVPTLARLRHDPGSLREAHERGRILGVFATGPIMAVGALAIPIALPRLLGPQWEAIPRVVALSCVSTLVGLAFALHSSLLAVVGRQGPVIAMRIIQLLLLAAGSAVFMPRYGPIGFAMAELVRCGGFVLVEVAVRRVIRPESSEVWAWIIAWSIPLAAPFVGLHWWPALLVPPLMLLLSPIGRLRIGQILHSARIRPTTPGDPAAATST